MRRYKIHCESIIALYNQRAALLLLLLLFIFIPVSILHILLHYYFV